MPYRYAFAAQQVALAEAFTTYERAAPPELDRRMREFWQHNQAWLERDVLYQVLTEAHGGQGFRDWTLAGGPHPDQDLWQYPPGQAARVARRQALLRDGQRTVKAYVMAQLLVHEQHADLRGRRPGLELLGDLQVGLADQDVFSYRSLLLSDYVMGAPPSRTTPAGQAWGYAVLDPEQCDPHQPERNPALQLLRRRMDKMFDEYDAIRIDHPHGFVCPWVYRPQPTDPLAAVQHGARLFSSPDLPDHPGLARYAIVKPEQLCRAAARYADDWETDLRPEQIDRFAILFDVMVDSAHRHGKASRGLLCEVLSTLPAPCGLSSNAMTWVAFEWSKRQTPRTPATFTGGKRPSGRLDHGRQPRYPAHLDRGQALAGLAAARAVERASGRAARPRCRTLIHDQGLLVHALFAYLLASAAENVSVFFTDLLGCDRPYNKPGTVDDDNWSLRLAPDFAGDYARRLHDNRALNLPSRWPLPWADAARLRQGHGTLTAELLRRANTLRSPEPTLCRLGLNALAARPDTPQMCLRLSSSRGRLLELSVPCPADYIARAKSERQGEGEHHPAEHHGEGDLDDVAPYAQLVEGHGVGDHQQEPLEDLTDETGRMEPHVHRAQRARPARRNARADCRGRSRAAPPPNGEGMQRVGPAIAR